MAKFIGFSKLCSGPPKLEIFGAPGPGQSWPIGKSATDMKTLWMGDIWLKCLQMESLDLRQQCALVTLPTLFSVTKLLSPEATHHG